MRKIHDGRNPESLISKIVTPSKDFNTYLRQIILNDLIPNPYNEFKYLHETSSEKNFKILLKDIESKISIIFFIGLFFPIGLCFLILFRQIDLIFMLFFIPFFLIILNFLFKKFVKTDFILIGLLRDYSSLEKTKFDEFLTFLKSFAMNLKFNASPEKAFIDTYLQNKNYIKLLNSTFYNQITRLLNYNCSFREMLDNLKLELNSVRYNLILNTLEEMLYLNAYYTSEQILDILEIIHNHRKLEKKFEIIIKGEKFKVMLFIFLLPMIIGAIGGMFPLMVMLTSDQGTYTISHSKIDVLETILIFLTLFSSNLITSYYFLKIIHYEKMYVIFLSSNLIFILVFLFTFMNLISLL
ncbi:MAG: hypothetical protein EU539_01505 [Promethearchaeota archaeon]|nr:MAG: hypothetical protein EU539_01505 [Candidatus Lokiarchaeota archaeon]